MSHAISLERNPEKSTDATVTAIARETETAPEVVRVLYEEHVTALNADAKIKQFVSVIAVRRVKLHLRRVGSA
jgi:Protein of unknown function (DUF3562)